MITYDLLVGEIIIILKKTKYKEISSVKKYRKWCSVEYSVSLVIKNKGKCIVLVDLH
jgi:hypothetical protein